MSYLFVSIGGTGAKIMEALTHFCIAGTLPGDEKLYIAVIFTGIGFWLLTIFTTPLAFKYTPLGAQFLRRKRS